METDSTIPDWSREQKPALKWSPSRSLLASIRDYQRYCNSRNPCHVVRRKLTSLRHRFWTIVTGAEIPVDTRIGGGLLLPHPNGIVIHADAEIGPNCLIFQQVTIGTRGTEEVPCIGSHVDIGAGAKILGPVNIGNNVLIGANSVVLVDVPDNCTAVGIPATVIDTNKSPDVDALISRIRSGSERA